MAMLLRSASGRARSMRDFHQVARRNCLALQLQLAVRKALDIQERLDHARQPLGFLVDHFCDLLALLLAQVVAAHQLAGALDGGERRAHFVRDKVDGLLVALAVRFRLAKLPADDKVLIAGGGGAGEPRRRERREDTETRCRSETRRTASDARPRVMHCGRHTRASRKEIRKIRPARTPPAMKNVGPPGWKRRSGICRAPAFRRAARALRRPGCGPAVGRAHAIISGGNGSDAHKHYLALKSRRQRWVLGEILQGNAWDGSRVNRTRSGRLPSSERAAGIISLPICRSCGDSRMIRCPRATRNDSSANAQWRSRPAAFLEWDLLALLHPAKF